MGEPHRQERHVVNKNHWATKSSVERDAEEYARAVPYMIAGKETLLCWVLNGIYLFVDPNDLSVAPHLAMKGHWDSWTTLAVSRLDLKGKRVLNVGANFGYFTMLFAKMGAAKVDAYEPIGRCAHLLRASANLNGLSGVVSVHEAAMVTDDRCDVALAFHPTLWGGSSVVHASVATWPDDAGRPADASLFKLVKVPASPVPVDAEYDMIFMDVEGYEAELLPAFVKHKTIAPGGQVWLEWAPDRWGTSSALTLAQQLAGPSGSVAIVRGTGDLEYMSPEELVKQTIGKEVCETVLGCPR